MSAPFEKPEVRVALDAIASHVDAARRAALDLLVSQGDVMTPEAYEAVGAIASALKEIADDHRADHASGLMCEAVEELKKSRGES